jgi:hypothetical protein
MSKTKLMVSMPGVLVLTAILMLACTVVYAADAPRMSTEELKGLLGNPDVIILDVRTGGDWDGSDSKITGALRETKENFENWADKYPKDKTLVLYCS